MKAHYKTQTQSGRIMFEIEGQTPKDMFKGIAEVEETFDADPTCGCCNSASIGHRVRMVEEIEYYELYCKACTAALTFHVTRVGGRLYLKWEQKKSTNRGWKIWKPAAPAAANGSTEQPAAQDDDGQF